MPDKLHTTKDFGGPGEQNSIVSIFTPPPPFLRHGPDTITHHQIPPHMHHVWFKWSKASYSGEKWRCYRCGTNKQTTSKGSDTQLLICEAIWYCACSANNLTECKFKQRMQHMRGWPCPYKTRLFINTPGVNWMNMWIYELFYGLLQVLREQTQHLQDKWLNQGCYFSAQVTSFLLVSLPAGSCPPEKCKRFKSHQ